MKNRPHVLYGEAPIEWISADDVRVQLERITASFYYLTIGNTSFEVEAINGDLHISEVTPPRPEEPDNG